MPQDLSLEVAGRIDDWWSTAKRDILADPFGQMATAGLFQIGLPGAGAALDTYRAIAIAEQAIAAKTGLLGLASAFAARQMTARFFIAGFADADQRATWLPRVAAGEVCVAIAISEPEVGAHPKHLKTTAEPHGAAFVVRDVEDTVGTANVSGMLSWLLKKSATCIERTEANALRLGRIAGLVSLVHAASRLAVAALDGDGQEVAARTIGVRLLAHDIVGEIRDLLAQVRPGDDATSRALAAFDLLSSVARQPRKVRQIRLGNSVWS